MKKIIWVLAALTALIVAVFTIRHREVPIVPTPVSVSGKSDSQTSNRQIKVQRDVSSSPQLSSSPHFVRSSARPTNNTDGPKLEALSLKYRTIIYAEFAKRGTFQSGPPGSNSVILDVEPDIEKANEMKTAFWADMAKSLGADYVALFTPQMAARMDATMHHFGAQPITFQFDLSEIPSYSMVEPNKVVKMETIVKIAEINVGAWGGGQMKMEQFKTIYGDVAQAVIRRSSAVSDKR